MKTNLFLIPLLISLATNVNAQSCETSISFLDAFSQSEGQVAIVQLTPTAVFQNETELDRSGLAKLANSWKRKQHPLGAKETINTSFTLKADTIFVAVKGNSGIKLGKAYRSLNQNYDITIDQVCQSTTQCPGMDMTWLDEKTPRLAVVGINTQEQPFLLSLPIMSCYQTLTNTFTMEDYQSLETLAQN